MRFVFSAHSHFLTVHVIRTKMPLVDSRCVSRCSILACSSYVALALGDNLIALNHAEKLLHQTKLSGSLK